MTGLAELTHFPGYYVNGEGWLYKMRGGRIKPLRPLMNFPYGRNPYYIISVRGTKYILGHNELLEKGFLASGLEKNL